MSSEVLSEEPKAREAAAVGPLSDREGRGSGQRMYQPRF
jgi:hypothetical protein